MKELPNSTIMKRLFHTITLGAMLAGAVHAEGLRRLDERELSALDEKPTGTAAPTSGLVSKGIRPKGIGGEGTPRKELRRVYGVKGALETKSAVARPNAVRITFDDGTFVDQPLVEVPLLFRVGTAKLIDSRNLKPVIEKLRQLRQRDPGARFRIEGHASAEGDGAANERLSMNRAVTVMEAIAATMDSSFLRVESRGSRDAQAPATAPESERQLDRKVLIVRES